jgi:hypothetical protein
MFIAKSAGPGTFAPVPGNQPLVGPTSIRSTNGPTTLDLIDHMASDAAGVHPLAPSRKPQDAETQMRMANLGSSLRFMIAAAR